MARKYVDIPSIVQVIGGVYTNNSLLDHEGYFLQKKILQKIFIEFFLKQLLTFII